MEHTISELTSGDAKIAILTDGECIAAVKVVTAEEFEGLQESAEKWTCGNLSWRIYEVK